MTETNKPIRIIVPREDRLATIHELARMGQRLASFGESLAEALKSATSVNLTGCTVQHCGTGISVESMTPPEAQATDSDLSDHEEPEA